MNIRTLKIDGYPVFSRHRKNDLTQEAARRAEQDLRNAQRLLAWHGRVLAHGGAATISALLQPDFLNQVAGESVEDKPTAELVLHPTFQRRRQPQQGNQGLVKIQRHKRQIRGAKLPQPPEAA